MKSLMNTINEVTKDDPKFDRSKSVAWPAQPKKFDLTTVDQEEPCDGDLCEECEEKLLPPSRNGRNQAGI